MEEQKDNALTYICTECRKEIHEIDFGTVISCPNCSSKVFFKKMRKTKRLFKCV
ncbi:MAG: hypothetical protein KAQ92_04810 [Candidatus Aenigmarchaeota archaeon]|nr:hypothetical protein [Candidatus Aenigmarchaeota archaeon]